MHSFIKRNQKTIMVIFSVGLTIAFALPSAVTSLSKNRDVVMGRMGKTKISQKDVDEYRAQWTLLKQTLFVKQTDPSTRQERTIPILLEFFGRFGEQEAERVIAQIDASPALYYLLYLEAEQLGVAVTNDEVQNIWKSFEHTDDNLGGYEGRAQEAIRNLLLIGRAADQAASMAKVTRPQRDHELSNQQEISLNLVEFKAADFLAKLPPWSDSEKETKIKAQYELYKNQEPTTRPGNEFGFGYRVSNQVRVQYIELPSEAIRRTVTAQITDIDARKYFYQNISQFPAQFGIRPPAGVAASQPSAPPRISKVFTDRPATSTSTTASTQAPKHFEQYRQEITQRLIDERIGKLSQDILAEINSTMGADYLAFKGAITDVGQAPSTAPSIPPEKLAKAPKFGQSGITYDSYEYLHMLANRIQEKFGVLPTTHEDKGLRSLKQLSDSGEISKTAVEGYDLLSIYRMTNDIQAAQQISQQISPLINFPVYATNFALPFANDQVRQYSRQFRLRVLALYEPSPVMREKAGDFSMRAASSNAFIYRIAEAEPAHAPPLADVRDQVIADAKLVEAYKAAGDAAAVFFKNAQEKKLTLQAAAVEAGKPVITTGLFDPRLPDIENFKSPSPGSSQIFITGAYALLNRGNPSSPHPMNPLDFKPAATAFIGEINQIKPRWTADTLPTQQINASVRIDQGISMELRRAWYSAQDIVARTHYIPQAAPRKPAGPPPQQQPPINPMGAASF